ncbi:MAG: sulfatase-like hydrolase/transferase [Candidatus Aminicenantes bacterium]|nr:sulfatase-like hydrolase/transferase [Candidatus Aminicenantes bacterium]
MKKKILILIFCVLIAGVIIFLVMGNGHKTWEGNILIITLDTTRADTIGCYGNRKVKTPNLDRLGKQGIRFVNCFSPVPLTLPSHCTVFTGKYPLGHGVRNNGTFYLKDDEKTLAEIFKAKKYNTYAVIAAFVLLAKFGLKQGFDLYDDSLDSHKLVNTFKSEITADEVYEKFESWFRTNWEKNFFAWVHFYDPHTPYQPPKEFFDIKKIQNKLVRYRGEVAFMDVYVGKIIDSLEKRGILDKTLVVVVGDHGEAFGEHVEFAGHSVFCYQENLRVPFIIFNRRFFKNPMVVQIRVATTDIMPTILELTGSNPEVGVQGRSMVSLLAGGHFEEQATVYIESMYGQEEMGWAPLTGVMAGEYKYISLPEPELYNLVEDPGEKKNLIRIKSNVSRKMDEKLRELVIRYSSASGESKRVMSKKDIQHLKSLGYISAFSGKTSGIVDPKKGIVFNNRIKKIAGKIKKGKLAEAETELNRIMRENPEMINYALISQLFAVHIARNDVEAALDSLRDGIKRFPDRVNFRTLMGQVLYDQKRYQEVFTQCREILEIDPYCTWAYILKGDSFDQLNNPREALENYCQALELEPENISMRIRYAELLLKNTKLKEALAAYNAVLDNRDVWNTPRILYKIALFNASHGTLDKAEQLLKRILEIKPEGKYYYMYALILFKNKKLADALHHMKIAINQYREQLDKPQREKALEAINTWQQAL